MKLRLLFALVALLAERDAFCRQQSPDATRLTTRSIQGRVLTSSGAPAGGAVVLLKDGKTLQVRSYIAQQDGLYHFFGLSTDVNYMLRAENQGLTSKDKTVSVFDSHKTVKLDLRLTKKIQEPKIKK